MPPVRIPVAAGVTVRIPAAAANHLTLPVCVRHGRRATSTPPMVFAARPPAWTLALLVFGGGLLYLIVAYYVRKEVFARAWPWCGRCGLVRLRRAVLGLAVFAVGGKLAVTYGDTVKGPAAFLVVLATASLMITGWVVLTTSTRSSSAGVKVSRDGEWLDLPRAHERFVASLPEVMPLPPAPAARPAWHHPPGQASAAPFAAPFVPPAGMSVAPLAAPSGAPAAAPAGTDGWQPPGA